MYEGDYALCSLLPPNVNRYQNLHEIGILTYLGETVFSAMTVLKTKQRPVCNFLSPFGYRFNSFQN